MKTKCNIYECQKDAEAPFKACSLTHSVKLKDAKQDVKDYTVNLLPFDNWYRGQGIKAMTIGEFEHYSLLI